VGPAPPPPRRLACGCGSLGVEDLLDVALGDLQALAGEVGRQLADRKILELFRAEPVQVFLDALPLGDPGRVTARPSC
jgi:hypothetical protein